MNTTVSIPRLETRRLVLRAPDVGDVPACATFMASERSRWIGGPLDDGQTWRALASLVGHWHFRGFGQFLLVPKGETDPIGMAGPWQPHPWPEPELAWSIWDPACEGQGLAFEAVSAARDWAYRTRGWTTAVSYIDPDNARSRALATRLGARIDPDTAFPFPHGGEVWRHPGPEAQA